MRIEFVNREQEAVPWNGRPWRIGSAGDCELRLADPGVAPHHLTLSADARGILLEVAPGAGHVYVNARPVRERALLRVGDSVGVAQCQLRLCREPVDDAASRTSAACVVSVRALAGPLSGRAWRVGSDGLTLGEGGPVTLQMPGGTHARLELHWRDGALWLCAAAAGECIVRVDGEPADEVPLSDGEQIAVGAHRFVVDVAGARRDEPESPPKPSDIPDDAGPRAEVWWLLATAAALALLIALLLVRL